jgi:predicted AAA+ superfamily ATPase
LGLGRAWFEQLPQERKTGRMSERCDERKRRMTCRKVQKKVKRAMKSYKEDSNERKARKYRKLQGEERETLRNVKIWQKREKW